MNYSLSFLFLSHVIFPHRGILLPVVILENSLFYTSIVKSSCLSYCYFYHLKLVLPYIFSSCWKDMATESFLLFSLKARNVLRLNSKQISNFWGIPTSPAGTNDHGVFKVIWNIFNITNSVYRNNIGWW